MATAPKTNNFTQHPIPGFYPARILGALAGLVSVNNDEELVIPAPSDTSISRVFSRLGGTFAVVTNDGGAPLVAGDVELIYKTSDGREFVIYSNAGGEVTGAVLPVAPALAFSFPLAPGGGIYLRVAAAPTITFYATAQDVRADLVAFDIPNTTPITLSGTLKDGEVGCGVQEDPGDPSAVGAIFNFDSVPHNFSFAISDGTETIVVGPLPVAAGDWTGLGNFVIPAGWTAKISMGEAVATVVPQFVSLSQKANASPVKRGQGGAY